MFAAAALVEHLFYGANSQGCAKSNAGPAAPAAAAAIAPALSPATAHAKRKGKGGREEVGIVSFVQQPSTATKDGVIVWRGITKRRMLKGTLGSTIGCGQGVEAVSTRLLMSRLRPDCFAVFYQSDAKLPDGSWLSKTQLVLNAGEAAGLTLMWHKIACIIAPDERKFGRPGYTHIFCFAKNRRGDPEFGLPDVLATRGDMIWKRGVGMSACELIFKYIARSVNATLDGSDATLDGSDADGSSSDASKKKKKSTVANKKVLCIAAKTDARIESLNSDTPAAEKVAGHTDTTLYTNCSDVAHSEDRATVGVDEIEAETLAAIQTIVDPFCGHGSFLAMASRYGFDSIGVERTKKRAKTAAHALFL
eukprot:gene1628-10291_t